MPPRSPPAIADDLIFEILLRLPPSHPACLARAAVVCKLWRRLLSDGAFLRRYHEFHGRASAPPLLGFLYNKFSSGASGPLLVPTTKPLPFSQPAPSSAGGTPTCCRTLDCRHGRVLLHPWHPPSLTVWDPITGKQRCFLRPGGLYLTKFTAAVLCATAGCSHRDCSGGPFLVVLVARRSRDAVQPYWWHLVPEPTAWAALYSSETRKWSESPSIVLHSSIGITPSLVAGDAVFFVLGLGESILKYDFTRGVLSVISAPLQCVQNRILRRELNMILCTAEDGGGLGVATVEGSSLRLLSWRTDSNGVGQWAQGRVIELDSVIPNGVGGVLTKVNVDGFAEGTGCGCIFIRANDSMFTVELKSGRISKIGKKGKFGPIFPFTCFYTPDIAS